MSGLTPFVDDPDFQLFVGDAVEVPVSCRASRFTAA